eukprot:1676997-Karenia_brevis.AAC.1
MEERGFELLPVYCSGAKTPAHDVARHRCALHECPHSPPPDARLQYNEPSSSHPRTCANYLRAPEATGSGDATFAWLGHEGGGLLQERARARIPTSLPSSTEQSLSLIHI